MRELELSFASSEPACPVYLSEFNISCLHNVRFYMRILCPNCQQTGNLFGMIQYLRSHTMITDFKESEENEKYTDQHTLFLSFKSFLVSFPSVINV